MKLKPELMKFFILFSLCTPWVMAQQADIATQIREALKSNIRNEEDRAGDASRKPAETFAFFGLKNNMRVMELMPSDGYSTKILGQVLADNGKLYLGLDEGELNDKLVEWGLTKVEILKDKFEMTLSEKPGYATIKSSLEFPVKDLDMVLDLRALHDFTAESRKLVNTQIFKALKSGGIYGVTDHTRRHMEPYNEERWRRLDPVHVIMEIQSVGFEFVDYSDLHYNPGDGLRHDPSVDTSLNGDSDRFTMVFRKP